jgi:hypothetical protein
VCSVEVCSVDAALLNFLTINQHPPTMIRLNIVYGSSYSLLGIAPPATQTNVDFDVSSRQGTDDDEHKSSLRPSTDLKEHPDFRKEYILGSTMPEYLQYLAIYYIECSGPQPSNRC